MKSNALWVVLLTSLVACDTSPTSPDAGLPGARDAEVADAAPDATPRPDAEAGRDALRTDTEDHFDRDAGPRPLTLVDRRVELLDRTSSCTADLAMIDVNGDGALDVVWLNFVVLATDGTYVTDEGRIDVSLNDGAGRLTTRGVDSSTAAFAEDWFWLHPADLDGDGDLDLLVTRPSTFLDQIGVFDNDGTGRFREDTLAFLPTPSRTHGIVYGTAATLDLEGDGDLDVVVPVYIDHAMRRDAPNLVFLNEGDGSFTRLTDRLPRIPAGGDFTLGVGAGDYDGDGATDLFLAEVQAVPRLLLNRGGTFEDHTALGIGRTGYYASGSLVVADLDHDGDLDIVSPTVDNVPPAVRVFENDGRADFTTRTPPAVTAGGVHTVVAGDVDGNGRTDLVWSALLGTYDPTVERVELDESGTWVERPITVPLRDNLRSMALGDLDGDGDLDLVATSTMTRYVLMAE